MNYALHCVQQLKLLVTTWIHLYLTISFSANALHRNFEFSIVYNLSAREIWIARPPEVSKKQLSSRHASSATVSLSKKTPFQSANPRARANKKQEAKQGNSPADVLTTVSEFISHQDAYIYIEPERHISTCSSPPPLKISVRRVKQRDVARVLFAEPASCICI